MAFNKDNFVVLCLALGTIVLANPAYAQNWEFEPIVKVGGEYDDNATLIGRTDLEVELSGVLVDLEADIRYSSATTFFSLEPRVLLRNYSEPEFDSDDIFLRSDYEYTGRSSTFGFRAFYDEQAVRTGERADSNLQIDDPDDITGDDTGRVVRFGDRSKLRFVPKWDYRLSNISSIGVGLDYFDVKYDDVFADLLVDYTDTRINLNYSRGFSNVNTGLLTLTGRSYSSDGALADTTGYGVLGGFRYALSEKTQLMAMVGIEVTEHAGFDFDPVPIANIVLTRRLETIRLFAQYRRSVNSGGSGRLSVRDALNLNFRRYLSEKVSAGLGVRAYQTKGVDGSTTIEDRRYVQLHANFRWYLSPAIVIEADYRYSIIDRGDQIINGEVLVGELANSNQVNLWFVYQPRTTPGF